ncbi:CRISPR-associated endonuclease Cas2 [Roseimaritima sediminicola]|uniref:CRISPR-associated endonuclease Cas2 n=1 Tax=Roseimaritima sediminicola TaxID=2662066 RepID=UPI00138686B5|nr:CRISPR-associated endonuclease Cas2 [Roseimaritima sediminicola]
MWLVTMFDLPVTSKRHRRNYTRFRNRLLDYGFDRLQFSVYARFCGSEARGTQIQRQIEAEMPTEGYIRFLMVTDRQFAKMSSFHKAILQDNEQKPAQILLF